MTRKESGNENDVDQLEVVEMSIVPISNGKGKWLYIPVNLSLHSGDFSILYSNSLVKFVFVIIGPE